MDFYMPRVVYRPARCYYPAAPVRRYNNHVPFLSLLDDTFNELNRVSKYHYRRPAAPVPAPRFVSQRFDIRETNEAYQVEGELPGFDRNNIEIEFTDEKTLVVRGKSERKSEPSTAAPQASLNAPEQEQEQEQKTLLEKPAAPEAEAPAARPASETGSVKSYQASVEDDYEDLGEDYTPPAPTSNEKGKEKVTESVEVVQQPQPAPEPKKELAPPPPPPPPQQQQPQERNWVSERSFGSFTRTFRFPVRVNTDAVAAKFDNGVLSISVPKATAPGVRHILIV